MKRNHFVILVLVVSLLFGCSNLTTLPQEGPTDAFPFGEAKPTCTVTTDGAPAFATWFADGKVEANGIVTPADSTAFDPQSNCTFYQWSERMFLWLTSSLEDGNPDHFVFNSSGPNSTFFIVSPPDSSNNNQRSFVLNTGSIVPSLVILNGKLVEVEEGQAGGGDTLMTQGGSFVYYMITTNDVFAYFLTGTVNKASPFPTEFPSTPQELAQITDYASKNGATIKDANTMALEIKTSWVEVDKLPQWADSKTYITMAATIPVYTSSASGPWIPSGTSKTVRLALVGMHVVGSANGQPEMIWATFEHKNNTPAAQFTFLNPQNKPITIPQNTTGNWLFSVSNPPTGTVFNQPNMKVDPATGNIVPIPTGGSVSPSNTIRSKAWGSASNITDPDPVQANTDIISMNTDILNSLVSGDLRSNYILIGATWTSDGNAPTISSGSSTNTGGNQIGTNMLSNSTMETYHQDAGGDVTSSLNASNNCFSCHNNNGNFGPNQAPSPIGTSHIFGVLLPLFTTPATSAVTPTP